MIEPMSLLIKNATIITQNKNRDVFKGSLFIDDQFINEISKNTISVEADVEIDASGQIVIPGLINSHTHLPMTLLRGYGDDMVLSEWLQTRIWPVEAKLSSSTVKVGAQLGLLEMMKSGTTTFFDMYFFEDEIAEVVKEMGFRAVLGFAFIDHGTPQHPAEKLFPHAKQFIKKWNKDDRIIPGLAPHGTYTCGPGTLQNVRNLADQYHIPIQIHCAETRDEVYDVKRQYGKRPIAQLKEYGLLNSDVVLAHCGWITKNEINEMKKTNVNVSHCPVSNMKIATGGFAPVPEMIDAHICVSLGTDGAASNNTLDMFETMKFTALIHKQHRWDPKVLPAQTVFDFATLGGAQALGLQEKIGSLEEGKLADVVIVDFNIPRLTPCHDPISHLVYAASGSDVRTTIVHGNPLVLDNKVQTIDEQQVLTNAQEEAKVLTNS
ncbi:MAG TPA: amidohydrolase [Candidatus Thermoplasmatota archaeon]|nr:amidohydrolase [Candidatus Thermoplasmatota archaeon]